MRQLTRHYRLSLSAIALVISALSLAIWTTSTAVSFYGPWQPAIYRWAGLDISGWVPAIGWCLGFTLLAVALVRRGSVRAWVSLLGVFLVFSMGFAYWGVWSFSGGKAPSNCCPILQVEATP